MILTRQTRTGTPGQQGEVLGKRPALGKQKTPGPRAQGEGGAGPPVTGLEGAREKVLFWPCAQARAPLTPKTAA